MSLEQPEINTEGSVLQEGAEIRGNIQTEKDMSLKGIVWGDVSCKGKLEIAQSGVVNGNVVCLELAVDGVITGDVEVGEKASLTANAVIKGFLQVPCLLLHPDAAIDKGVRLKDKQ